MHQPDDPGAQQIVREVHHYHGGDGHRVSFGRLIDVLIPVAIAALVGTTWKLSNSVTLLTEQVSARAQITEIQLTSLKEELARLNAKVEASQGKP